MKILRIEWPDQHHAQLFRLSYAKIRQHAGPLMATYARHFRGKSFTRPWVAEITDNGLEFIDGFVDYSAARGIGEGGVFVEYQLNNARQYLVREWTPGVGEHIYRLEVLCEN